MKERNVAIYARVSTEHEAQIAALDNQIQYYDNILNAHPEWTLVDKYIDEGITGTSTKKRKNFMKMMSDAEAGMFDLIVTREVSRFARNTVDTLQETRKLKRIGVEVWFTEDNIWTMNDEDGELRLTLMATLAQNESKKTSLRVKAGQKISFENAIPYGNGNILGYDRCGKEMVINPEQAATVKRIFELYLSGHGIRKIQFILEQEGRLTATGMKNWSAGTIGRILKNPFYCGTIVYRKEYVPDYLDQKKITNHGDVDNVIVEGKHTPIVSKEDFARVQEIISSKGKVQKGTGRRRGEKPPQSLWCRKLECSCGHRFNRIKYHKNKDGVILYTYQCRSSINTGTVNYRLKRGLSIEGICDVPMVQEWKLAVMSKIIFESFWSDKQKVLQIAEELLEHNLHLDDESDCDADIRACEARIEKIKQKLNALVDLRLTDGIPQEIYVEKKNELEIDLDKEREKLKEYKEVRPVTEEEMQEKLKVLKYALEQDFKFDLYNIPESIIDAFVEKVIVYKDHFAWKLCLTNNEIICRLEGNRKKCSLEFDNFDPSCVQQHRQQEKSRRRSRGMEI